MNSFTVYFHDVISVITLSSLGLENHDDFINPEFSVGFYVQKMSMKRSGLCVAHKPQVTSFPFWSRAMRIDFFFLFLSAAIGFLLVRGIVGPVSMVSCGLCFQSVVIHHLSTDTGELVPGLLFGCDVPCFKRFSHLDKGLF